MPRFGTRAARDVWWFFLVLLVGHTLLVAFNLVRSSRNEALVTHTLQVQVTLSDLLTACIDAETGIRGFVITGDDDVLSTFERSQRQIPVLMARLRSLTNDNRDQRQLLDGLVSLLDRRQEQLRTLIEYRRRAVRDLPAELSMVNAGRQVMAGIRGQFAAMNAIEDELLLSREQAAKATFTTAVFTTIVGGLTIVGMLILTRYLIRRESVIRRRGEESLRLSEQQFGVVAETLPQIVWSAKPDGSTDFYNRKWHDYTALSPEESLNDGWIATVHNDDLENTTATWRKAVATGTPFQNEYRIRQFDGSYRWFLGRAMPLLDSSGAVTRWLGTCTDIDDQRRANEALEERVQERTAELSTAVDDLNAEVKARELAVDQLRLMATELARSNRELEQFAYVASHDLQEPLRKIQAFSDRLKTRFGTVLEGQGQEYLERLLSASGRMRRLISDLLAFSRVSTRGQSYGDVNLETIAREVLVDLEAAIERTDGKVVLGPLPTIRADALQMRQLFQNLLSNALKFQRKGIAPVISVTAEKLPRLPADPPEAPSRPAVQLTFKDNGIGFENAYAERIFQVFQRLHGRDDYEGTGIGLAVVRKIVERHGGTVVAHGELWVGATFVVVLPLTTVDPPE